MSCSAIASIEPRRRATVAGQIRSVRSYERPYPRTEAELSDGTGTIVLRFVGRRRVPGLSPGRRVVAEGTLDGAGVFMADTVLAKHDERYMPKEVVDALKRSGHWQEQSGRSVAAKIAGETAPRCAATRSTGHEGSRLPITESHH